MSNGGPIYTICYLFHISLCPGGNKIQLSTTIPGGGCQHSNPTGSSKIMLCFWKELCLLLALSYWLHACTSVTFFLDLENRKRKKHWEYLGDKKTSNSCSGESELELDWFLFRLNVLDIGEQLFPSQIQYFKDTITTLKMNQLLSY